jgi:hypothetical protein
MILGDKPLISEVVLSHPPWSPIASEGEESPEIESFEETIARFDVETPVRQWYGDASCSGFRFDYGGMV